MEHSNYQFKFVVSNEEYEKKFEEPIPGAISEIIMYQATLNYEKSIFLSTVCIETSIYIIFSNIGINRVR